MPLEATVCMLDNSDYAINSDVTPTRLAAASDAVRTIFRAKTSSNPESTCGLMTFAGKGPTVLVTPTVGAEEGKIHHSLPNIVAAGSTDLMAGLSVAGLALKHRQDKNQRQRAVVLLGSPLPPSLSSDDLVRLGKRLKKNNVAVDVVLYGAEATENEERMRAFVEAVNSGGNSTFVVVPPGAPGLLSDHIRQSEILREDLGYTEGPAAGAGGGGDGSLDLDPNLDPELAMALRMSLQDEEARQAAAAASSGSSAPAASTSEPAPAEPAVPPAEAEKVTAEVMPSQADESMGEDDAELARALALSRGEDVDMGDADESEEDAIARAIAMSMQDNQDDQQKKQ